MKGRVVVTHTLYNSRDGLVPEYRAISESLYVELIPYVKAGTMGDYDETEFVVRTYDGDEYYVPEEYLEEML